MRRETAPVRALGRVLAAAALAGMATAVAAPPGGTPTRQPPSQPPPRGATQAAPKPDIQPLSPTNAVGNTSASSTQGVFYVNRLIAMNLGPGPLNSHFMWTFRCRLKQNGAQIGDCFYPSYEAAVSGSGSFLQSQFSGSTQPGIPIAPRTQFWVDLGFTLYMNCRHDQGAYCELEAIADTSGGPGGVVDEQSEGNNSAKANK